MLQKGDNNVFSIYADADESETRAAAAPVLKITVPQSLMGSTIELGSDEAQGVEVEYKGEKQTLTAGTLQVSLNGPRATIILKSETGNDDLLGCRYGSNFTQVYEATNAITVTNASIKNDYDVASALVLNPAQTGYPTTFAFSDVAATDAKGMLEGKVGVSVGIAAASVYNGTIDLANDNGAISSFKLIDYTTRIVYDKVKSGTVTTAKDADGKLYIKISATMEDLRTVELEFYGATTAVESLDDMIPAAVAENEFKYYNSDGAVSLSKKLGTCYADTYKGKTTFYFIPEGDKKEASKSYNNVVQIQVNDDDVVNKGKFDLATMTGSEFIYFRYQAIQVGSPKSGMNACLLGTVEIKKGDDGVYEFSIDISNRYKSPWGSSIAGDNTRVVLHYKGTFEKYN